MVAGSRSGLGELSRAEGDRLLVGARRAELLAPAEVVAGASDLDGEGRPAGRRAAGVGTRVHEALEDVFEGGPVGAPVADHDLFLDPGGRRGHRDRLFASPARGGAQARRGARPTTAVERLGVGLRDLAEGREARLLEGGVEVGRKVGEEGERLAREERAPRSRAGRRATARPGPGRGHARGQPRRGQAQRRVEAEPALDLVLDGLRGGDGAGAAGESRA